MKFAAAYLLTVLGGKEPTKENIEAILSSVGVEWGKNGDTLLKQMEGKDLARRCPTVVIDHVHLAHASR